MIHVTHMIHDTCTGITATPLYGPRECCISNSRDRDTQTLNNSCTKCITFGECVLNKFGLHAEKHPWKEQKRLAVILHFEIPNNQSRCPNLCGNFPIFPRQGLCSRPCTRWLIPCTLTISRRISHMTTFTLLK